MPTHIPRPIIVEAAGNKAKRIEEFVGPVATGHHELSVAQMASPSGWEEPGQTPEFDEFTIVLAGRLHVRSATGDVDVTAGQAIIAHAGEWVQYSTPDPEGASYVAVCLPAFSPQTVHRDTF